MQNPNHKSKLQILKICLAAFFSGGILACISPPLNWHLLHWVSFVPLFLVLQNNRAKKNFWIGWFSGFVAIFLLFFWLIDTLTLFANLPFFLAWLLYLVFCVAFAIPYGIVCSMAEYWRRHFPNSWIYPFALSWVAVEYLTPALFPYYQGLSQYRVPIIWQIVSVLGVSGLSFLVILTNGMLTDVISRRLSQQKIKWFLPLSVLLIFAGISVFGFWRVQNINHSMQSAPSLKVGLIQVADSIKKRMQSSHAWQSKMFSRHSKKISQMPMDLLVWPEGILVRQVTDLTLDPKISEWINGNFGLLSGAKIIIDTVDEKIIHSNSVALFERDGQLAGVYDKMILVPFGESIPKSLEFLNPNMDSSLLVAGDEPTVLSFDNIKITTPICYEAILKKQMLRLAAGDVIFNVTEDGWFGNTAAPHQHAMLAATSATELGRPLVRSAVNGVNMVVAANGLILYETTPFQDQADVVKVPLVSRQTFYTRAGHYFAPACLMIVLGLMFWQKKWLRS